MDQRCHRDVLRGDADALEDHDVVVVLAAGRLAADDLGQLVHLEPVEDTALDRLDQVAGLDPRLLAGVAADEGRALEDCVVELPGLDSVRAGGADQRAGLEPLAAEHRVSRVRDRDDHVLLGGITVVLAGLAVEPPAEVGKALAVSRIRHDPLDSGQRRADAEQLALRLPAGADEAERSRFRLREVSGRDGARRTGAELSEAVGLDQREQLGAIGGEEREDEARPLREAGVGLHAGTVELEVGRCHHVQAPSLEPEPVARLVLHRSARDAREAPLDRLDGVRRAEELLDVGFAKVERHGAG